MQQEPLGVVSLEAVRQLAGILPSGMARAVVDAAVRELGRRARRDGGAPAMAHGLRDVLAALDAAGIADTGSPSGTMGPSLVTVAEAAETAGVSERRVRQLAASGRLRSRRYGRQWLIELSSAEEYRRERPCQSQ